MQVLGGGMGGEVGGDLKLIMCHKALPPFGELLTFLVCRHIQ